MHLADVNTCGIFSGTATVHVYCFYIASILVQTVSVCFLSPQTGGWGCLMSSPCLESQGCHLIPLCYLLSCSSAQPVNLSVLSFSACWPFLLNFFQKILQYFSIRDRLFCMAPVQQLGEVSWSVVCAACCHMTLVIAIMHLYNLKKIFIASVHSFFTLF